MRLTHIEPSSRVLDLSIPMDLLIHTSGVWFHHWPLVLAYALPLWWAWVRLRDWRSV